MLIFFLIIGLLILVGIYEKQDEQIDKLQDFQDKLFGEEDFNDYY